jgi:hypothetical protein
LKTKKIKVHRKDKYHNVVRDNRKLVMENLMMAGIIDKQNLKIEQQALRIKDLKQKLGIEEEE